MIKIDSVVTGQALMTGVRIIPQETTKHLHLEVQNDVKLKPEINAHIYRYVPDRYEVHVLYVYYYIIYENT